MKNTIEELNVEQLRRICDPAQFKFKSTAELSPLEDVLGQDRAVHAVSFGIEIQSPGYHMFALGPSGTGKATIIQKYLIQKSANQPIPDDWCYVNNFEDPDRPKALRLAAGMGRQLQEDMDELVENLQVEIPNAFETKDYEKEQDQIEKQLQKRRQALFDDLEKEARELDFHLMQTPRGIMLAPMKDGDIMTNEEFERLPQDRQEELRSRQSALQEKMRNTLWRVQELQQEAKEEVRKLDEQVIGYAAEHLIDKLKEKYKDLEEVTRFLVAIRRDILENVEAFKRARQMEQAQENMPLLVRNRQNRPGFDQYRVNLIVDHAEAEGAPVVLESNPTYANLVGRVEHQAQFGALVTNFMMIKAGSLHRANGGYLMVNATDILTKPQAWEGLKRALKDNEVKIESLYQALGAISTRSLDPEPIPLDIKVVVTGNPMVYYLLYNMDEDFRELFKVKADFAVQMDWEEKWLGQYARFIAMICEEEHLRHFSPSGVARIIEQSARMVSHQGKLSTKFGDIVDLVRQASYWAGNADHDLVGAEDVARAIDEQIYRSNKLEERIQEMIEDHSILIDTRGEIVGQVNGISVLPLGDYEFGRPSRITARTYVGQSGVVNIDREIELGGKIHNKGILILTGYLGGNFAHDLPMAFSASITFEQLYEEVEGDSASSAELYALLSSLSGYPIRQNLAVTGSVNQRGQVQAIGGVNEKIEGFFKVCQIQGLTGEQGVVIPRSNVKNLMLREEVVQSIRSGKFHIYPVETIDEGIEILTGFPAGERNAQGRYPEESVYYAVDQKLRELAGKVRQFSQLERAHENGHEKARAGAMQNKS